MLDSGSCSRALTWGNKQADSAVRHLNAEEITVIKNDGREWNRGDSPQHATSNYCCGLYCHTLTTSSIQSPLCSICCSALAPTCLLNSFYPSSSENHSTAICRSSSCDQQSSAASSSCTFYVSSKHDEQPAPSCHLSAVWIFSCLGEWPTSLFSDSSFQQPNASIHTFWASCEYYTSSHAFCTSYRASNFWVFDVFSL